MVSNCGGLLQILATVWRDFVSRICVQMAIGSSVTVFRMFRCGGGIWQLCHGVAFTRGSSDDYQYAMSMCDCEIILLYIIFFIV